MKKILKILKICFVLLKQQEVKPDEIILVDNFSNDNTVSIAQNFNVKVRYATKKQTQKGEIVDFEITCHQKK